MARDTAAKGLANFRARGLKGGGWKADGGSTMESYFIRGCLFAFPNIYTMHVNEFKMAQQGHEFLSLDDEELHPKVADIAGQVILGVEVDKIIEAQPSLKLKRLLIYKAYGYTNSEIVALTDYETVAAVKTAWRRLVKSIQEKFGSEGSLDGRRLQSGPRI